MKSNKTRSIIIAVILVLLVGFGLFNLQIESADVPTGGDTQQMQQNDMTDDVAVGDNVGDDIADNSDNADVSDNNDDVSDEPADDAEADEPADGDDDATDDDVTTEPNQPAVAPVDPVTPPAVSSTETGDAPKTLTCTYEIRCDTVVDTSKLENQAVVPYIPADGVILATTVVEFNEGDTAFDALLKVTRANNIQMEFSEDNIYGSAYIEGINYLYEFDAGPLSGWMYRVNDWFPNYGTSNYKLADGDVVVWLYTCDLGTDVGDNSDWH